VHTRNTCKKYIKLRWLLLVFCFTTSTHATESSHADFVIMVTYDVKANESLDTRIWTGLSHWCDGKIPADNHVLSSRNMHLELHSCGSHMQAAVRTVYNAHLRYCLISSPSICASSCGAKKVLFSIIFLKMLQKNTRANYRRPVDGIMTPDELLDLLLLGNLRHFSPTSREVSLTRIRGF
jgi:hypothetical protein